MVSTSTYSIAPRGLATSFTEAECPVDFALKFRNRYINAAGGAEKRSGMTQNGNTIAGGPTLTALHELVLKDGTAILLTSGGGVIYKSSASSYESVYSGGAVNAIYQSVQMDGKLIFVNGVDRAIWTKDASTFETLRPIMEEGQATSASTSGLADGGITTWLSTQVGVNDILYNRSKGGYAVVTVVATGSLRHTAISSAGGATGLGSNPFGNQANLDRYEILDSLELNIIPTDGDSDNVATLTSGAGAVSVRVSGVNFATTEARAGDWVYNSTLAALAEVTTVTSNLVVTSIAGQTVNDTVIFLKSAVPIPTYAHVHFNRLYMVDERDQSSVGVSGPRDPQNWSTNAGTIDSQRIAFGSLQPDGDTVQAIKSYQRFLALLGKKNTYLFEGTDPIASTAAANLDFAVVGLFPQGLVSKTAVQSIGNDLVFVSYDGVQTITTVDDASNLNRNNLSETLKATLTDDIRDVPTEQIVVTHYPRRSFLLVKVGSTIYVFNYTPLLGKLGAVMSTQLGRSITAGAGSWSLFDGLFAQQLAFMTRLDGTLVCCGAGGKVYTFDPLNAVFDDAGIQYTTEYQSPWLTMDEPTKSVNIKDGRYIQPVIDASGDIAYTIRVEGGFQAGSTDSIVVSASGGFGAVVGSWVISVDRIGATGVENKKFALRWRGDVARFTFTTDDSRGPEVLSRYSIYSHRRGKR